MQVLVDTCKRSFLGARSNVPMLLLRLVYISLFTYVSGLTCACYYDSVGTFI